MEYQTIIIAASIVLLAYWLFTHKKKIGQELLIAALISFAWVHWSGMYVYKGFNIFFLDVNLFPFIAWTAGLVILREFYERVRWKNKFWKIYAIYIVALLIMEWIGYNTLGIQLDSCFPGLLGMELLHAPGIAKIFYLTIGPLYLLITDYLEVK